MLREDSRLSADHRRRCGVTTTRDRCGLLWSKAKALILRPEYIQPGPEHNQPRPEHNLPMASNVGSIYLPDRRSFGDPDRHEANRIENHPGLRNSIALANIRLDDVRDRANGTPSEAATSDHNLGDNVEVRHLERFNNVISRQHSPREPDADHSHRIHEAELNAAELKQLGLAPSLSTPILTEEEHAQMAEGDLDASHDFLFDGALPGYERPYNLFDEEIKNALFPEQLSRGRAFVRYMQKFRLRFYKDESHASAASVSPRNSLGHAGSIASSYKFVCKDTDHRDRRADAEDGVNLNDSLVNDENVKAVGEHIVADGPPETNPYRNRKGKERAKTSPCEIDLSRLDEQDLVRLLDDIEQASHSRQDSGAGGAASDWNIRVKGKGKATNVALATPGQWPSHAQQREQHGYEGFQRLQERIYRRLEELSEARVNIVEKKNVSQTSREAYNTAYPTDNSPRLECQVCGDSKPSLAFPLRPPTATCAHSPNTCTTCTHTWLASELATKGPQNPKCPRIPLRPLARRPPHLRVPIHVRQIRRARGARGDGSR